MSQERQRRQNVNPNDTAYALTTTDIRNGFSYLRTAALTISEKDMRAWEIITDVPVVHNIWGYICLVLNIILPGSGTILASFLEPYVKNKT